MSCVRTNPTPFSLRVFSRPSRTDFRLLLLTFALLNTAGCENVPSTQPASYAPNVPRLGHVYLVRGWMDLYSEGIDTLAAELREQGIRADAYAAADWQQIPPAIMAESSEEPLVLIGFSYGADDVVQIARELETQGRAVDLLITIDPVTPPPVPGNVQACFNYYQSNGLWDVFPWFRGVSLEADGTAPIVNQDLRSDRTDLLEPDTAHATIAANPKLHRELIARALQVCFNRR